MGERREKGSMRERMRGRREYEREDGREEGKGEYEGEDGKVGWEDRMGRRIGWEGGGKRGI